MDQNQQDKPVPVGTYIQPNLQQPSVREIPSSGGKWKLILLIIALLIVAGGGAYYLNIKLNMLKQQARIIPIAIEISPTPTVVNLNPNTGNLYNDINVRLHEVIK